jgi:hypothetical protein
VSGPPLKRSRHVPCPGHSGFVRTFPTVETVGFLIPRPGRWGVANRSASGQEIGEPTVSTVGRRGKETKCLGHEIGEAGGPS